MGTCRYCGKPARFLRHQHRECRQRHDDAAGKIPEFFVKALQSPMAAGQFRNLIDRDAAANFIASAERDQLVNRGFAAMIGAAFGGNGLDDAVSYRIAELQHAFELSATQLGAAGQMLTKGRILLALDEGKPSPTDVIVAGTFAPRLEAGEQLLWAFNGAGYLTMRSRTQYVGGSHGVSMRIMRGVYYRVGAYKGEAVKTQYLSNEDSGSLAITPRNVYFVGSHKALKIPLRKIGSAQLYSDGIEILQNGVAAKPMIFTVDDATFAANLLARLQPA